MWLQLFYIGLKVVIKKLQSIEVGVFMLIHFYHLALTLQEIMVFFIRKFWQKEPFCFFVQFDQNFILDMSILVSVSLTIVLTNIVHVSKKIVTFKQQIFFTPLRIF